MHILKNIKENGISAWYSSLSLRQQEYVDLSILGVTALLGTVVIFELTTILLKSAI